MAKSFGKQMKDMLIALEIASVQDIEGCSDEEIKLLMTEQNVTFLPAIYRQFLREMGRRSGWLYQGSDYAFSHLHTLKDSLNFDLKRFERSFRIPDDAFVFLAHQGYIFWYFHTQILDDDPAVYQFYEDDIEPILVSKHLSDFFEYDIKELKPQAYEEYKNRFRRDIDP